MDFVFIFLIWCPLGSVDLIMDIQITKTSWSDWLHEELSARNWRQADLVRESEGHIKRDRVSKWLAGKEQPSYRMAAVVADVLEIPFDEVLRVAGYGLIPSNSSDTQKSADWWEYVKKVAPSDSSSDIARKVNIDRSAVTRWSQGAGVAPKVAVQFAHKYNRPVVEALLASGLLNESDVADPSIDLKGASNQELVNELADRLEKTQPAINKSKSSP
ncbi:helix-turn-helix transcriptional regulator [Lysinibacter sp. HNR]|uniref:helix-turn-helix domain-containing protein n=1 Tax=Lysinibacter sp. HNR TaxID=3031408 RepID=UPI002435424D|nr:helix-turn-helix transcriptional regulator [Lysinibacter sp. HNR]WGD38508.1 helix-turn-helix transcriptional regulator [Lysinibacter sp. HNR]